MSGTLLVVAQVGILAGVFMAMLAMGTSVPLADIGKALRDWRTLGLALVANFVAVPLLALLVVRLLPLPADGKTALLLLGAAGGAPVLPKLAELAGGPMPYSIGLMLLLMGTTVLYAPIVVPLLLPGIAISAVEIARSLIALMLLPLMLGLLSRLRYPNVANWSPELHRISGAAMVLGLSAGLLVEWRDLLSTIGSWILIGAALLALGAAGIGWLFGWGAAPEHRRVTTVGTGMRNFSAALLVAERDAGTETLVMTMAATIALSVVMVIVAGEFGRQDDPLTEPGPASG